MEIVSTDTIKISTTYCGRNREMVLMVGQKYVVDQLNPRATRNRGRIVELLGFNSDFMPDSAIVKYLDNNRRGRVSVSDLAPYAE